MNEAGSSAPASTQFSSYCAPVLLIGFNRPEHFERVLAEVLIAKPERLYVALDGPRESRPEDFIKVTEVRERLRAVDGSGVELSVLVREENLGCRRAVSGAIDWFFTHEEAGIILEDDCLPKPEFFRYCTEMLDHWRDDERVFTISGNGILSGSNRVSESYGFSTIGYIWGWATWRRAWQHYHGAIDAWQHLRSSDFVIHQSQGYRDNARYWRDVFDGVLEGRIDSWAYQWTLTHWINGGVCAVPTKNLVHNIGFGRDATHTTAVSVPKWMRNNSPLRFPLIHPTEARVDPKSNRQMVRATFGTMYGPMDPRAIPRRSRAQLGRVLRSVGVDPARLRARIRGPLRRFSARASGGTGEPTPESAPEQRTGEDVSGATALEDSDTRVRDSVDDEASSNPSPRGDSVGRAVSANRVPRRVDIRAMIRRFPIVHSVARRVYRLYRRVRYRRFKFATPTSVKTSGYEFIVDRDNELVRLGDIHEPSKRNHNYLPYYWMHLRDIREQVVNVLEIGLQTPRSMNMWEEFFPNATIHGLDIDPACKVFEGDRRVVHIGDQSDPAVLQKLVDSLDGPLDVVIDDGSHRVEHQIRSFEVLFPLLSEHGVFVVEDTGGVVGDFDLVTVRPLQRLVRHVMYWPSGHAPQDWPSLSTFGEEATWADRNVIGVAFYRWIVFIMKGRNPEDNPYLSPPLAEER